MREVTTTDNNGGEEIKDIDSLADLRQFAGRTLGSLQDSSGHDLWLYPQRGDRYEDKIQGDVLFSLEGNILKTGNIMGFVGCGGTDLTIRSRFSKKSNNDWFMQYMLHKVFRINVFDLNHSSSDDASLKIAVLMLPFYLQKALRQGLYREYIQRDYNDSHLRGSLDFSRHIIENYPFKNGRIAYSSREYCYDNAVTQLIRHTIEFVKTTSLATAVLLSSAEMQANIRQIEEATPSYRKSDLRRIMLANARPKIHPFYSEYRPLQRLCMQILRGDKVGFGSNQDKIHGVLFDGAWLWEEYLYLIFEKSGFDHPENRKKKGDIGVFRDRSRYTRYPDFIKDKIIADAKYKRLLLKSKESVTDDLSRDDLNQMITYLHITSSRVGVFVNPLDFKVVNHITGEYYPETLISARVGSLCGDGGIIYIIGLVIPQECSSYEEFVHYMESNEAFLLRKLREITDNGDMSCDLSFGNIVATA